MNERIRELYKEAEKSVAFLNNSKESKQLIIREKFAELIVRDCAVTAGLMEHQGRSGIGAQILDNFGVES